MVTDPTDKKHLPEDMRASVAYLLDECFQHETKYLDKLKDEGKTEESPTAVKLEEMHRAYSKIIRQSWGVSASDKSEVVDEFLNEDIKELMDEVPIDESGKFKRIEDMSLHELRVISKVLAAVHHSVTQRNKAFNEAIKEELSQLGTNANADFESKINKKGEKSAFSLKWLLFVFLAFIGNGMCSVAQKMQQIAFDGAYKSSFMILSLGIVSVIMCVAMIATDRRCIVKYAACGWYLALGCGLLNGAVNLFVMILSGLMDVSLMFPLISVGGIVLTFLISKFFYREQLTKAQYLGFLFGIGAIVLLNIKGG
jgi:hypothetical protein